MSEMKRSDMGIASALIVVAQAVSGFHSSNTISNELDHLKQEVINARLEREQYFVRKTEMKTEMRFLSGKIDQLSDQVAAVKDKVSHIQTRINRSYSLKKDSPLEVSASD